MKYYELRIYNSGKDSGKTAYGKNDRGDAFNPGDRGKLGVPTPDKPRPTVTVIREIPAIPPGKTQNWLHPMPKSKQKDLFETSYTNETNKEDMIMKYYELRIYNSGKDSGKTAYGQNDRGDVFNPGDRGKLGVPALDKPRPTVTVVREIPAIPPEKTQNWLYPMPKSKQKDLFETSCTDETNKKEE
jgi:hypothetical protein